MGDRIVPSEFLVAKRWDYCTESILRSTGYGAIFGSLSLFLFGKRWMRLFGIGAGVGAGFGLGVSECRASFNRATRYDPNRVLVVPQGTKVNHHDGTPKH